MPGSKPRIGSTRIVTDVGHTEISLEEGTVHGWSSARMGVGQKGGGGAGDENDSRVGVRKKVEETLPRVRNKERIQGVSRGE